MRIKMSIEKLKTENGKSMSAGTCVRCNVSFVEPIEYPMYDVARRGRQWHPSVAYEDRGGFIVDGKDNDRFVRLQRCERATNVLLVSATNVAC